MYCPNCGKPIRELDNFCRYCGADLRKNIFEEETPPKPPEDDYVVHHYNAPEYTNVKQQYDFPPDNSEEYVLYEVKKHWMSLFWPMFLTPVFFIYFWTRFLNTHSITSWLIVFVLLGMIIYPILRYVSDKIVITTKFVHIKIGVLNPEEVDIPLKRIGLLNVSQTVMGRMFDYGTISFSSNSENFDFNYIKSPEDIQYIIDDPARFIHESLEEDEVAV